MADDRLRGALLQLIRDAMRGTAFHRLVRARVVNVLAGGAVETEPETAGTPRLPALPLRYGLPGVLRAVVKNGARALIGWAEGDPAQPYVAAWDASELEELVFDVSGGAQPLARTGDTGDGGTLYFTAAGAFVAYAGPGAPPPAQPTPPEQPYTQAVAITVRITGTSRVKA
jgi:hypothetical protein